MRTHLLVPRGDQRINPVARNGDERSNPVAGWGDQRTHPFAMKGDRRTRPVDGLGGQRINSDARLGDQNTHPVTGLGLGSRTNLVAGWAAEKKTKCELCGEILPAGPDLLQIHKDMYHFQEVIELD